MNVEEKLLDAGYENVKYLTNYSYDEALIGVSEDNRAVYDFNKMVEWLVRKRALQRPMLLNGLNTIQFAVYPIWAVMHLLLFIQ